ncbi:MAG: rRNA maturation RNase YbeY [Rhodospirillaceae bacterium]|jgi:probable rRNA maturation factor|nr:rRNA maturation RNase YbeY [Rhodospirillaceae bacterium]MBT3930861.1 rRNA maturation RNase YbeY [Rhodospirillaceae bacterium]MBT6310155.1 rRNA maturation RNase YbeY [Rhodospirillaceae bacterium]MBT6536965.1 rRNA maturation RNase YbeY [Rhodospirillaceae bacterium]MBT7364906.1 rRNA maturation RNase YbeY [Rhodospirillaceae bacterium]
MTEQGGDEIVVIVDVVSPDWRATDLDLDDIVTTAARAALVGADVSITAGVELGVRLTDDAEIRTLNRDWRDRDAATNVLAFALNDSPAIPVGEPAIPVGEPAIPVGENGVVMLGDVVVAYETSAGEAVEQNKSLTHHLSHLVVHGTLHLLGFDHEREDEAEIMEALERVVLHRIGIPDPYLGSEAA